MDVRFSEDLLLDEEFIISQEKIKVQEEEEPSLVEEEVNEKKSVHFGSLRRKGWIKVAKETLLSFSTGKLGNEDMYNIFPMILGIYSLKDH